MVPEAYKPATITPNFIQRNIQTCSNPRRTLAKSSIFSVRGVSVLLYNKGKLGLRTEIREPILKQPVKKTINIQPETFILEYLQKVEAPPIQTIRFYSGVLRTSIQSRESVPVGDDKVQNIPQNANSKIKSRFGRTRWFTNREVITLPVTSIPKTLPQSKNSPEIYLKVTGQGYPGRSGRWEALDFRSTAFDGLLATMDKSNQEGQSANCAEPTSRLQNSKGNSCVEQDPDDNSYHQIYQRHVDTLTSVIAQDQIERKGAEGKIRLKKKGQPKLEIKIAPVNDFMTNLTQDLEGVRLAEEVENCGDLTPVITYSHVSTVSNIEEFQYNTQTVSPGTSSKGSRSPSPLLEVPMLSAEISTKFPTV